MQIFWHYLRSVQRCLAEGFWSLMSDLQPKRFLLKLKRSNGFYQLLAKSLTLPWLPNMSLWPDWFNRFTDFGVNCAAQCLFVSQVQGFPSTASACLRRSAPPAPWTDSCGSGPSISLLSFWRRVGTAGGGNGSTCRELTVAHRSNSTGRHYILRPSMLRLTFSHYIFMISSVEKVDPVSDIKTVQVRDSQYIGTNIDIGWY